MNAGNWLAGLAGGIDAVDNAKRDDERQQLEEKKLAVQEMLGRLAADTKVKTNENTVGGATERNVTSNRTRKEIADANREQRANAVIANTDLGYSRIASNEGLGYTREAGRNMRADNTLGYLWDKNRITEDANYRNDDTRRAGQASAASTAIRAQDLLHQDRGAALDQSAGSSRAQNALRILGLKAREKTPLMGAPPTDPTDWADEFDRIYNRGASPEELGASAPDGSVVAPMSAPGTVAGDGLPVRRAMPKPRSQVAQPPARPSMPAPRPQTAAPATSGKTVTLAQLQQLAARRGSTVDQEQQRATAEGYVVVR